MNSSIGIGEVWVVSLFEVDPPANRLYIKLQATKTYMCPTGTISLRARRSNDSATGQGLVHRRCTGSYVTAIRECATENRREPRAPHLLNRKTRIQILKKQGPLWPDGAWLLDANEASSRYLVGI